MPYFNGGLFKVVRPVELSGEELDLLSAAASENWGKVNPAIFGTLFQSSMDKRERHAYGAHFTSEADIQKVVRPTIVRPWRDRTERAKTLKQMLAVRDEMVRYRVLDPACGSGNFLYIAYREMKRLEMDLLKRVHDELPPGGRAGLAGTKTIRENYSREGGLDYIVKNGGTITEAVSIQPWSGSTAVHVSIVNWLKGDEPGVKQLYTQKGDKADGPIERAELPYINSSLSVGFDVSSG